VDEVEERKMLVYRDSDPDPSAVLPVSVAITTALSPHKDRSSEIVASRIDVKNGI
jgi:hypothetical protein